MLTIFRGEHFSIQHFRASGYVRVRRSDVALAKIGEAVHALGECSAALGSIEAPRYGILFDWRRSPLSTDPSLHRVLANQIDSLAAPFARRALLVGSTVGLMQASRVGRNHGDQKMSVFDDERAAIAYVTTR